VEVIEVNSAVPVTASGRLRSVDGRADTPPRLLTIGQVARESGFTVRALRFYERRGLLPPFGRRPSGYRVYSETDVHRLEFIRQAKALGLTLEAVRELVVAARAPGRARVRPRLRRMLDNRIAQTIDQIATLSRLRQELERRRRLLASPQRHEPGRGYCTCLRGDRSRSVRR
jgi:DNA-binding transcriptional MerR regulator